MYLAACHSVSSNSASSAIFSSLWCVHCKCRLYILYSNCMSCVTALNFQSVHFRWGPLAKAWTAWWGQARWLSWCHQLASIFSALFQQNEGRGCHQSTCSISVLESAVGKVVWCQHYIWCTGTASNVYWASFWIERQSWECKWNVHRPRHLKPETGANQTHNFSSRTIRTEDLRLWN